MKKSLKHFIAVFMATLLALTGIVPAYADLTEGKSYSFETKYLDAYYDTGEWETANGHTHDNQGQVALRWLTSTGEPVYCIQIYNETDSSTATAEDIESTNLWKNELSDSQQRMIKRVSIWGYPNFNYGYSDQNAQIATQVLLWEIETGARTDYSTGCTSWAKSIFNNYENALKAYNAILEACSSHNDIPSFNSQTVELGGVGESNAVTLTDSNGVLSKFTVTSDDSRIKTSISGNTLKVWIDESATINGTVTATLTFTKINTATNSAFALTGANQTLFYGTLEDPVTTTLSVKLTTGNVKLVKTSEDGEVSGIKFTITNGTDTYTATTDSDGEILFEGLTAGSYTVTEESISKYVPQTSQTVTVTAGKTASVSFSNVLKKFRVTVTKTDAETTTAQGDATLEGAVYGIYQDGVLVDTYTTDENGQFVTDYYVCGDNWTIQEITASEGYLLDETVYDVGSEAKLYTVEYNTTANDVTEQVIKGYISIIKHTDDGSTQIETPESGATFQIYLKSAGSYEAAEDTEKETIVCDDDGYACTGLLPYGVYTVHQVSGWEGRELIADFDVYIQSDGVTYKYLMNNANFTSYLKVVKVDSETGKQIAYAGTGFEIYDCDGNKVSMQYTYPTLTTIDVFYTNDEGYLITPQELEYGDYTLVEVEAPYGYVLDSTPVEFSITQENSSTENGLTIVTVTAEDISQKGIIEITKTGEILTGWEETETDYGTIYTPVYTETNLAGAIYEVRAAEDIVVNGDVIYNKGDVVDTITTSDEGLATTIELPLGSYEYQEITAPTGYTLDTNVYTVELEYQGQTVSVFTKSEECTDARQTVDLTLYKELEENVYYPDDEAYKDVVFAVYANEDILDSEGNVILAKDSVVDYITVEESENENEDGQMIYEGHNTTDLPLGYTWYVKEVSTADGWYIDEGTYEFGAEVADQSVKTITVYLNDGESIINEVVTGYVEFRKVDADDADIELEATYGVYRASDGELLEQKTSKIGEWVSFTELPAGDYYLQEIESPTGYTLSDTKYEFTISNENAGETIQIVATDTVAPVVNTGVDTPIISYAMAMSGITGLLFMMLYLNNKKTKKRLFGFLGK